MSRRIRLFQVDAFTAQRFAGNPAGVVLDAQFLGDAEMLSLARELGNGDTAFVLPPDDARHDLRIRFFTPRKETAFVGHATLAAHAVLHGLEPRPLRRQQGQTGTVEVTALAAGQGFSIRQGPPTLGRQPAPGELAAVLALLGLTTAQLDPACPPQIVGAGSTRLLLGVTDGAALDTLRPQLDALGRMSAGLGAQGYFLFTRRPAIDSPDTNGLDTEARMFCPAIGIDEDPVSGNAHAMLGAYLFHHGLLTDHGGQASFNGAQGRHVGRPGRISIGLDVDADGAVLATRIIGQAVTVFQAVVEL
jgi:PhzF family phenazine biosynthesis protein